MKDEFKAQYRESYGSVYRKKPDFSRCAASVPDGGRWPGFHQCRRKNGHGPHGAWCKQHDPVAVKAKREERQREEQAKWDKKQRERKQANDDARLRPIFEAALQKIANGSNDPRADAIAALEHSNDD